MKNFILQIPLSKREKDILKFVIEDFIETASPVPSQRLKNKFQINLSPASIRNTLHTLEEIGLLDHLYTSSGRIPTDSGYRFYVEKLMGALHKPYSLRKKIMEELSEVASNVDLLLQITADSIAKVSDLFGFVCLPFYKKGKLTDLEIVRLSSGKLLLILGFQGDHAKTIVLNVSVDVKDSHLETVVSVLRERLLGLTIEEIQRTIGERLKNECISDNEIVRLVIQNAETYFTDDDTSQVCTSSKDLLLHLPEFANSDQMQMIVSVLDNYNFFLQSFVNEFPEGGIHSSIGKENPVSELQHCSVVFRDFTYRELKGQLGVIGPTRMNYRKIYSLLETVSETLQGLLND